MVEGLAESTVLAIVVFCSRLVYLSFSVWVVTLILYNLRECNSLQSPAWGESLYI